MPAEEKFTPIPNPYIVGNPIKSGEMFYGRQEEFLFAKRKIETGDKSYVIVFCGERRSGKTSILFQILSGKLGEKFLPVLIDMQTMAGLKNDGDFFEEIAQEICRTLKDSRLNVADYNFQIPQESPYKSFRGLLDKILTLYPDKHLVLMIDEYEMIEEKFDEGSLSPAVITFFAGLLESARRLSFVFTGSRHLEQRKHIEYWRVLFGKSLYRRVSFLSREDTFRLITEPVRNQVTFQDGVVEAIYHLTAGQPFYTQVFCQNLLDHLNERQKTHVEPADIDVVTEGILQNPLPQMIYIWNSLELMEKLAFAVLAELQQEMEGFIPVTHFQQFLKKKGADYDLTKKDLTTALEHLYERELVFKKGEMYRIPIALLGQWVRREYSFWKILQELTAASQSAATAKPKRSKAGYLIPALGLGALLIGLFLFRNKFNEPAPETKDSSASLAAPTLQPPRPESAPIDSAAKNQTQPSATSTSNGGVAAKEKIQEPPAANRAASMMWVSSQPPGAAIFLNDSLLAGKPTPALIANLVAGEHRLRIEKDGYRSYARMVTLQPDKTTEVRDIVLEQLPPGFLEIIVKPYAKIYLDDSAIGASTSYCIIPAASGWHTIRFEHLWGNYEKKINVTSADTVIIEYAFQKP
jgi:AAA+ ATPase superfamily predicted ATPase